MPSIRVSRVRITLTVMVRVSRVSIRKVSQIGTVRYNWPTSAHASQAFSIAPVPIRKICLTVSVRDSVK